MKIPAISPDVDLTVELGPDLNLIFRAAPKGPNGQGRAISRRIRLDDLGSPLASLTLTSMLNELAFDLGRQLVYGQGDTSL